MAAVMITIYLVWTSCVPWTEAWPLNPACQSITAGCEQEGILLTQPCMEQELWQEGHCLQWPTYIPTVKSRDFPGADRIFSSALGISKVHWDSL